MNLLILGKPGAGKGTITKILEDDGFIQLSTGDLLREEISTNSELGKKIDNLLKEGKFASDETIFKIVKNFLNKHQNDSIIFDGFPRNLIQLKSCFDKNIVFDKVFVINVDDNLLNDRIVNRRIHLPSGRVYNLKSMPPKNEGLDDITGEPLVHRNDDKLEILKNRLMTYYEQTEPILEYLKVKGLKVVEIDGASPLSEQINQIKLELNNNNSKKLVM